MNTRMRSLLLSLIAPILSVPLLSAQIPPPTPADWGVSFAPFSRLAGKTRVYIDTGELNPTGHIRIKKVLLKSKLFQIVDTPDQADFSLKFGGGTYGLGTYTGSYEVHRVGSGTSEYGKVRIGPLEEDVAARFSLSAITGSLIATRSTPQTVYWAKEISQPGLTCIHFETCLARSFVKDFKKLNKKR
ncbi:MAG: hypothetical protein AB1898_21760 [Acidobacteriota bacterium]